MKEQKNQRSHAEEKLQKLYKQERELRHELETERKKRIEFIKALAHELKTPLTPLLASSDLLVAELPEGPLRSLARNINQGASNLNNKIDELLDLARAELGMLRLNSEPVDILHLLQEVVGNMSPEALSRRQYLTSDLPSSLPVIQADETRLRQVMHNLINKALKLTPEGGTVSVKAKEGDATLIVEVKNTGRGIAKEEQQRLFEPYRCLENAGERFSGLELALSKMLVELHGGQIWVKSHVGKGSTFFFSLPLEAANQRARGPRIRGKS